MTEPTAEPTTPVTPAPQGRPWLRPALIALVAFAVGVAATATAVATVWRSHERSQARHDALTGFYSQPVFWGPCQGFDGDLKPEAECTRIKVPVDYENPSGETALIALSRTRASGERVGSVLFNPGGPGQSGLWLAEVGAKSELAKRFDRVGFDPRGVGSSIPTVRCFTGPEHDADRADDYDTDNTAAGIENQERHHRDFAEKCTARTGSGLLAHLGTREVVKDMDIIRAALGEKKLNYVGFSYGTRLGTIYAATFPQSVRALVLDGAIDPKQDKVSKVLKQTEGFQKAFNDFAAECVTHPGCPFGTDAATATDVYRGLVNSLINNPARTEDKRGLSHGDATTGTIAALYSPTMWPKLAEGISELQHGRGDVLLKLADRYDERDADGKYAGSDDAQAAIRCVDEVPIKDRKVLGDLDMKVRTVAPFLDDGRGTGNGALSACSFWPVPNTMAPGKIEVKGLPMVVVVSTTHDPATPYQAGVELAKDLGARLVSYEGTKHTIFLDGNKCIDAPIVDYLIDPSKVPSEGLSCPTS